MEKVSQLFDKPPMQWGLRGDPLLWEEMRIETEMLTLPNNSEELRVLLKEIFCKLTEQSVEHGKNILVSRYREKSKGMSNGIVSSDFWLEKGFPLIIQRYNKTNGK
jgi:molybdenum cofactor cytidylyltransferase